MNISAWGCSQVTDKALLMRYVDEQGYVKLIILRFIKLTTFYTTNHQFDAFLNLKVALTQHYSVFY